MPSPHPISETHSRWIFFLLSRVEDYVSALEFSLVRHLARACTSLIYECRRRCDSSMKTTASDAAHLMGEPACWLVVTAVVGVWGQRDLWMDAEAMLRRLTSS